MTGDIASLPADQARETTVGYIASPPADQARETAGYIAELAGYGRLSWDVFRGLLGGAQAAWAGYDGFHIGGAPPEPPPYSHLWAWTGQWLIRARIDGGQVIVSALILQARPVGPAPVMTEAVSYEQVTAQTWDLGEQRVGPMPPGLAGRQVTMYLVSGERPVTFVAVGQPS